MKIVGRKYPYGKDVVKKINEDKDNDALKNKKDKKKNNGSGGCYYTPGCGSSDGGGGCGSGCGGGGCGGG